MDQRIETFAPDPSPSVSRLRAECPMDQRIETFLADVLALAGEAPDALREGVRVALADCEAIFRARQDNRRIVTKPLASAARCAALASSQRCRSMMVSTSFKCSASRVPLRRCQTTDGAIFLLV
jgi:hypothetical protein